MVMQEPQSALYMSENWGKMPDDFNPTERITPRRRRADSARRDDRTA